MLLAVVATAFVMGCTKDPGNGGNNGGNTNSHAYVDLGLPSGTLWATCNIGASAPEDYGDYFAWGETQPKDYYDWSTYQYCMGDERTITKYCNDSSFGYNGFTDTLTILQSSDDAATANWGSGWRIPTQEQWRELRWNTNREWRNQNGINGYLFTAGNGNSLFLPAAGYRRRGGVYCAGSEGEYWSNSRNGNDSPIAAEEIDFSGTWFETSIEGRCVGFPVRAVRSTSKN